MKGYFSTHQFNIKESLSYTNLVGCKNCHSCWSEPCPEGYIPYINGASYIYDSCDNCIDKKNKIDVIFGLGRPYLDPNQSADAITKSFTEAVKSIKKNYPEDWEKFIKNASNKT